jgi:hypothetical protein
VADFGSNQGEKQFPDQQASNPSSGEKKSTADVFLLLE